MTDPKGEKLGSDHPHGDDLTQDLRQDQEGLPAAGEEHPLDAPAMNASTDEFHFSGPAEDLDFTEPSDFAFPTGEPAEGGDAAEPSSEFPAAEPAEAENLFGTVESTLAELPPGRNPGRVHRLDMDTSGLLLFARGADVHRRLSRLFRERAVMKRYIAIVAGRVDAQSGAVDLPLAADWPNRPKQKVAFANGKHSLTRYRLLANAKYTFQTAIHSGQHLCDASRIELEPVTGRTHQLRVHMAAIGHPVLGDGLYGGNSSKAADRLLLHACKLSFIHPSTAKLLTLASEPEF